MRVEPWVVIVIMVAGGILFWVAQHVGWIDLSNKSRSSSGGGIAGIGDEVFHPTRHEAQVELDRQTILPAPAPLPGDGDFGIGDIKSYDGQVQIDLTRKSSRTGRRARHAATESAIE